MEKDEIIKIRKDLNMSQSGFAYALGTTATTVSRWERGKAKISFIWIQQIKRVRDTWK